MIDIAKSRAAIDAMQAEMMIVPKAQMAELLDAVERGQNAQRVLGSIRTIFAIAGNGVKAAA